MEEVDNIIIHTLKNIGCDVDEGVESIQQFTTELIISATVKCLQVIRPDGQNVSDKLPQSMSARFRLGSALAEACKDIGYKGEVGYQTFLYANEADIRRVLMFLIEKLPKETEKSSDEPIGSRALLNRAISSEIDRRLKMPWLPSICKFNGLRKNNNMWHREGYKATHDFKSTPLLLPSGYEDLTKLPHKDVLSYYKTYLLPISSQVKCQEVMATSAINFNASSVAKNQEWEIEWNTSGLPSRLSESEYKNRKRQRINKRINDALRQEVQSNVDSRQPAKGKSSNLNEMLTEIAGKSSAYKKNESSRFAHTEKLQFTKEEDQNGSQHLETVTAISASDREEELKKRREEEQENLTKDIEQISDKLDKLDLEMKKFGANVVLISESNRVKELSTKELKESYKVKKQTIDLLPEADANIKKLQEVVEGSASRLVALANQWEKHRAPLITQYRDLKELSANKLTESQQKLEEIKILREKIKENVEKTRQKDDLQKQLVSEYERMTKDINRSAYTRRILEIVSNIKKQKDEIDKVLVDTKSIQKEINQLSGKLDRTFTVTDEVIFRDAKKDESVRKAYKYLAALHENCDLLIKTVEETGSIVREIRELEDQIDNETQKNSSANLQRISSDYKQMKQENAALMSQLKK